MPGFTDLDPMPTPCRLRVTSVAMFLEGSTWTFTTASRSPALETTIPVSTSSEVSGNGLAPVYFDFLKNTQNSVDVPIGDQIKLSFNLSYFMTPFSHNGPKARCGFASRPKGGHAV